MRALHALLAAVLAAALVVVPVGAATVALPAASAPTEASPQVSPATPQVDAPRSPAPNGTVEVLALSDTGPNRSTARTVALDVGPAVAVDANASSQELRTRRATTRVREADDPTAALAREFDRLEARANALGRRQRAALRAFAAGEADARRTTLALVRVDRAARALDDRRTRLVATASRTRGVSVDETRSAALARELRVYAGPVRERAGAALAGDAPPTRVFLSTTPRGVSLAALTESGYVRETYRGERRRTGGMPLNRSAASAVVADAYPSVWTARQAVSADAGRISRVRVTYDGGELAATAGAGNRRVFRDVHRQSLVVAGTNETAVNTRDGLQMAVNRSYAGGPMRIRLTDADGDPANASLTVGPAGGDSVPVGRTGADGERWTLTPAERFTVVAIRDQSVVFITMDPLRAPRADAS